MADFREFDGICKAIQVQIDQAYQRGYADGLSRGTHCGYKRGYERAQESMPNKEERALLNKWRDSRGISMQDFADALDVLQQIKEKARNKE